MEVYSGSSFISAALASEVNSERRQQMLDEIGGGGSLGGVCCPSWPLLMLKTRHGDVDTYDWILVLEKLTVDYLSRFLLLPSAIVDLGPSEKVPFFP
jgi:hypothetical protein